MKGILTVLFTLFLVINCAISQSPLHKLMDVTLTKDAFDNLAKKGYKGILIEEVAISPKIFRKIYQIPQSESFKNTSFFTFDYDLSEKVVSMFFSLRVAVNYEKGCEEVNYRVYGKPTYFRFDISDQPFRCEFFHEVSSFFNRYHFYIVSENIPNQDTEGYSDGIVVWGWTNDKRQFIKDIKEL